MLEFGEAVPNGALSLAVGDMESLRDVVAGSATLAYDNVTWLIPGFALAEGHNAQMDAVAKFARNLQVSLVSGGRHG
jgi:hypothetical protein